MGLSWDFGPEILSSVPAPIVLEFVQQCVIKCVIIHNTLMNKETVTKSVEVLRLNEAYGVFIICTGDLEASDYTTTHSKGHL